jgi:hypothetical protein
VFTSLIKRKRKFEISQNLLKIPDSTRALRRTYGRLHIENHINNKVAVLVSAEKKFITENKLLRKENKGLRNTLFKEKRKKKRKKALNFYEKDEKERQTLFFNPAKITRARERAAAQKEAEIQQKRTAEDKKLQRAIRREEKARKAAEKKARKEAERAIAREKVTRDRAAKHSMNAYE